ncbi:MAG: peptidylprolyl isomerase [Bacteroidetes bacterium]|nr:MAG: peptidylprolyl isomerase [Bacteroidota bacterium]
MSLTRIVLVFIIILAGLSFWSCQSDDPDKIAERDRQSLLKFIAENELDAIEHPSGLFYVVEREGTGSHPELNSLIMIRYTGYLLDDKVFDSSNGAQLRLFNTIRGWQIGIPLFREGGKGMLLVPSALGYGPYAQFGIPRNSCLIFEFELLGISQ